MKTSNILLSILFIALLVVPLVLLLGLRTKLGGNDYTVIQPLASPKPRINTRSVPMGSFSVLKVTSVNPEVFRCHLILQDSAAYSYASDSAMQDVLHFSYSRDTLALTYAPSMDPARHKRRLITGETAIDLYIPAWQRLEIDGATVELDSVVTPLFRPHLVLRNNGRLIIGGRTGGRTMSAMKGITF